MFFFAYFLFYHQNLINNYNLFKNQLHKFILLRNSLEFESLVKILLGTIKSYNVRHVKLNYI